MMAEVGLYGVALTDTVKLRLGLAVSGAKLGTAQPVAERVRLSYCYCEPEL